MQKRHIAPSVTAALGQQQTVADQAAHLIVVGGVRLSSRACSVRRSGTWRKWSQPSTSVLAAAQVFVRGLNVDHVERRGERDEQLRGKHGRPLDLLRDPVLKLCETFAIRGEMRERLGPATDCLPCGLCCCRSEVIRSRAVPVDAFAVPVVLVREHVIVVNNEIEDLAAESPCKVARDVGSMPWRTG